MEHARIVIGVAVDFLFLLPSLLLDLGPSVGGWATLSPVSTISTL